MPESISFLRQFILSWNLRNVGGCSSKTNSKELCIKGTCPGEYPIDAWKTYFLEIPKNGYKKDIVGRGHYAFGIGLKNTIWNQYRIIQLPIYTHSTTCDIEKLKLAIRCWNDINISEDIPCIALAVKCSGRYSEWREAQSVTALVIWSDQVGRIITLDWTEGPLEDCITPEWYIETTSLLNLRDAIEKMKMVYENISWINPSFSIYTIPSCLGNSLRGERASTSYTAWNCEWRYVNYDMLSYDLKVLLSRICSSFSNELLECDMNG